MLTVDRSLLVDSAVALEVCRIKHRAVGSSDGWLEAHGVKDQYYATCAIATANIVMMSDVLNIVCMELEQRMKADGLYRHRRKPMMKAVRAEVDYYEHRIVELNPYKEDLLAERNEAFSEQTAPARQAAYESVLSRFRLLGIPYPEYMAALHLARVSVHAVMQACDIWQRRVDTLVPPQLGPYEFGAMKPGILFDKLMRLVHFEFAPYADKFKGEEEDMVREADMEYVRRMADTRLVMDIIEGKVIPSWKQEDAADVNKQNAVEV